MARAPYQERDAAEDCLYDVQWKDVDVVGDRELKRDVESLILVGQGLSELHGPSAKVLSLEEAVESMAEVDLVVYEAVGEQLEALHGALRLLQAAIRLAEPPRLLLCTRG